LSCFVFFKKKTAYELDSCLVRSEMCRRDRGAAPGGGWPTPPGAGVEPVTPLESTAAQPGPGGPLPAWAAGVDSGLAAIGRRARPTPASPVTALNAVWTTGGRAAPAAPDPPAAAPAHDVLADLARRHEAGVALGRAERWTEALDHYRALAADQARIHGANAPETLRSRYCVGVSLGRLGRWDEALAEAGEVHAARDRVLGAEHPDTLVSRREIAVALGWLARWQEALPHYRAVADARTRVLGPAHPDTEASRQDETECLRRLAAGQGTTGR
ncbi:tetratricopeptide repeat protein, partial [Streptomyces sp. A7024]|nr:tetratricopeptide repeat protein [Streptomyces coryli]